MFPLGLTRILASIQAIGGQSNHKKHKLEWLSENEISESIDYKIVVCSHCGSVMEIKDDAVIKDEFDFIYVFYHNFTFFNVFIIRIIIWNSHNDHPTLKISKVIMTLDFTGNTVVNYKSRRNKKLQQKPKNEWSEIV